MADLELADETAPSALTTSLRVPFAQPSKFHSLVNQLRKVVSCTMAHRRPHSLVCKPKSILHPYEDPFLRDVHSDSLWASRDRRDEAYASLRGICILSNQGESPGSGSGSGGGAGEERNGGNQGIGGDVGGGGGQREGIGNERRGNRGRNHGGANGGGDDDGDDRGGWVGYRGGERGPMGPGPHRWEEIQLALNAQMIGTLESFDIRDLPARARIFRVVSLAFNSVAFVVLSASIGQRRMSPRRASILSWIGSFATLLGFISMIAMAFSASFIP